MSTGSVVGVGVDVAQSGRFARLLERGAAGVWRHWFTDREASACQRAASPAQAATLCFAVKEATYKAVGAEFSGPVRWRDIEALSTGGRWQVTLHGEVARTAAAAGVATLHVSTGRAGDGVLATVLAERATGPATGPAATTTTATTTTTTGHEEER
ncbi:MAG: holo-ACP synthase [Nocardioides sp.]|uniref:holo-ACP synthase n=1 Tax=Nocardioides sp. TaxID=35761 RepID=UPI003F060A1A